MTFHPLMLLHTSLKMNTFLLTTTPLSHLTKLTIISEYNRYPVYIQISPVILQMTFTVLYTNVDLLRFIYCLFLFFNTFFLKIFFFHYGLSRVLNIVPCAIH